MSAILLLICKNEFIPSREDRIQSTTLDSESLSRDSNLQMKIALGLQIPHSSYLKPGSATHPMKAEDNQNNRNHRLKKKSKPPEGVTHWLVLSGCGHVLTALSQ